MTHHTDIQVRFADTDALGHINNASFALYAEYARVHFLKTLDTDVQTLILAHLSLDFRKQVRFGEEVAVKTWVERVGNSSVTLAQEILAEGELACSVGSVVVHFDYEAQKAKKIPDGVREKLLEYS